MPNLHVIAGRYLGQKYSLYCCQVLVSINVMQDYTLDARIDEELNYFMCSFFCRPKWAIPSASYN